MVVKLAVCLLYVKPSHIKRVGSLKVIKMMEGKRVVGTKKEPQVMYCKIILPLILWFSACICVRRPVGG